MFGRKAGQRVKFWLMHDFARSWRETGHPLLTSTEAGEAAHLNFASMLTNRGAHQARFWPPARAALLGS